MNAEKEIGIALIGCGGKAASFRRLYTMIPGARLKLLVDINPATAQTASAQLDGVPWSTRFEDGLADGIDMLDISTPNHLHASQAVAALEAGKHVLIQKPLAPDIPSAELIVQAARRAAGKAGMYMNMLDLPVYHDLKAAIGQGLLGKVTGTACRCAHTGGLRMQAGGWRGSLEQTGGGSFIQLAIHTMNILQWLIDDRIVSIMAYSKNLMCPNVGGDDLTAAACEYAGGILGTVSSSYCGAGTVVAVYGTEGQFEVYRDRVMLQLNGVFRGPAIEYSEPGRKAVLPVENNPAVYRSDNPHEQHLAFVKSIRDGQPVPVPVETGLYDLRIVKAAYASAGNGRRMAVMSSS